MEFKNNTSTFVILSFLLTMLSGCGSSDSSDTPPDGNTGFTEINTTSGFSTTYLNSKTFYRPQNYHGNDFIETRAFTASNVSWDDNLFNNSGSNTYTIVSSNGIDGVIEYYDGVYNLHYNLHSVEPDHIKVCYTYTGVNSVTNCSETETLLWYFDRATAESNYP